MTLRDKITPMNRSGISLLILMALSLACAATPVTSVPQAAPSAGSVLFQDDFSRQTTGWDRLLVSEGIMDYDAGGYRILVNSLQTNFWATPRRIFFDARIEVDAGKLAGPDENRIGIICRFNQNNYYFFIISSDGFYGAGLFKDGQAALLGQSEMQSSANINKGLAVNHLRADCAGNTLTFYVNGFQIAQVQDSTLTSGDVGILAGTFDTPGVDIVFDNFVVLQP
ncbi:MAG: hypothetical protein C4557_05660 [Anaerolineaceae bacterium]|jgi:hypothetical protein|nr:MAG: hypothetical protein C4557_05660 [Anaerolineaceae bacterium]